MTNAIGISVHTGEDGAVVSVTGRIDAASAGLLDTELSGLIEGGERTIIVDMGGLEYISSSGLRVLLAAKKNLKKVGGDLSIAALKPFVREVFEISGFLRIFSVHDTVEEAARRKGQTG
ncbi:anti-sigma-factor antagonist [Methanofollis liminatans DSM 4140]|uniref:Anti-sigma-factor antagonist n=1 Tax=Methanofollis liminatans DSM 4140 TaxID=28892 RepID=J0S0J6_9EURY|nr:STAS domain-containing protein [Methanofollis liminatans]EJG07356.1 anti-sigma-factor antagonist [Methanofollis liminatans DSM 4140]